jgi:hypothetical protein
MTTEVDVQPASESGRAKVDALLALIISATRDATAEYELTGHGIPSPDSQSTHPLDSSPDALALKKAIRVLEGACEQLCTTLAQPMHTIANVRLDFLITIRVLSCTFIGFSAACPTIRRVCVSWLNSRSQMFSMAFPMGYM